MWPSATEVKGVKEVKELSLRSPFGQELRRYHQDELSFSNLSRSIEVKAICKTFVLTPLTP